MLKAVKIYYKWQSANIKAEMQYKKDFFISMITVCIQPMISLLSFYIFTSKFENLGGWDFWQITFLYSLWRIVEGLSMTFFQQSWDISRFVKDGTFDRFLIRPVGALFQLFCIRFQKIAFSQMLAGVALFIISSIQLELRWTGIKIVFLILSIITGSLVYMGITLIISSLSFWFVKVNNLLSIVTSINYDFMKYPMSIFPFGIQVVLTFILPYGFMSYIPAQFLLDSIKMAFPHWLVFASPLVGIGIFILSMTVFSIGIRHYNSTGN